MALALLPGAARAQVRDFSCYNSCMRQAGAMPYDCNQQCLAKKKELEHVYGSNDDSAEAKPKLSRVCFDRCVSQEGDDAVCREKCQTGAERKKRATPGNAKEKHGASSGCFGRCNKKGLSDADCLSVCAGEGSVDDFIGAFGASEGNSAEQDTEIDDDNSGFSGMHFGCFKKCRESGDRFDVCREVCAE